MSHPNTPVTVLTVNTRALPEVSTVDTPNARRKSFDATADAVLDHAFKEVHPEPFTETEREGFRIVWRGMCDILWPKFKNAPERMTTADLTAAFREFAASRGDL